MGVLEEDKHDQDHNNKVRPTFDAITMRKIVMEIRVKPTFECSGDKGHDEDLLHTITIACTTQGITNIIYFLIEEDEFVTNTTKDKRQN